MSEVVETIEEGAPPPNPNAPTVSGSALPPEAIRKSALISGKARFGATITRRPLVRVRCAVSGMRASTGAEGGGGATRCASGANVNTGMSVCAMVSARAWIVGDARAVTAGAQASIDGLLEIAPVSNRPPQSP